MDDAGEVVTPTSPNVVKLEMFVFDAIPLARNPLVLYTRRAEEFSPVKNAGRGRLASDGATRPGPARGPLAGNLRRPRPRGADGEPAQPIEISPAYALNAEDLRQRMTSLPVVTAGKPLLLA